MPLPVITEKEVQDGRVVAWLSYWGVLFAIPFFAQPENRFSQFHVRQGVNLLLWELGLVLLAMGVMLVGVVLTGATTIVAYGSAASGAAVPGYGLFPYLVFLAFYGVAILLVLFVCLLGLFSFYGIYNAATGRVVELPIVGRTARRFYPSSWNLVTATFASPSAEPRERCSSCGKFRGADGLFCGKCGERYDAAMA